MRRWHPVTPSRGFLSQKNKDLNHAYAKVPQIRVNNGQKFRSYITLQLYNQDQLVIPVWEAVRGV